ncbi:MAG TPA: TIGR03545 family protein [Treponema sp.]|nr:TIGR03545 family protein [Treponema sp.]
MKKKIKKHKLPSLFKKKYTSKKYNKKILKRIYIPSDKELIESLSIVTINKKGKTLYHFDNEKITDAKTAKKLKKISKDIKKQKGRFKPIGILVAFACIAALVFGIFLFRNVLARKIMTGAFEGMFGAKCDIGTVDFNLLDSRFVIDNLYQASKSEPMKNLFEVGHFEVYFNLLELTRGKIVSETIEITGITWGTERKFSGKLPPKKVKKKPEPKKPNPVVLALTKEVEKVKSGISVESGISAIQDQLDPTAFIKREKDALVSPLIVEEIINTVPDMVKSWEKTSNEVETQAKDILATTKNIKNINPRNIKTIEEARAILIELDSAKKTIESTVSLTRDISSKIDIDINTVTQLSNKARTALDSDSKRLSGLVNQIKSFDLDAGKGIVSDVLKTFVVTTLGEYYPYLDQGIAMLKEMQTTPKKQKKPTLKLKASAVERLKGRTFVYGVDSLPRIVFRNIELSATDNRLGLTGSGVVHNLTDDADKLNKPVTIVLKTSHGAMEESATAAIDLRSGAATVFDSELSAKGYPISIPSGNITGVPDLRGILSANGNASVSSNNTVSIASAMMINSAQLTVKPFKPAFIHTTYQNVLQSVDEIDFTVSIDVSSSGKFDISITTGLDTVLYDALQKEINRNIEVIKKQIEVEVKRYITEMTNKYSTEIEQFTAVYEKIKKAEDEIRQYEKTIEAKKAEIEKRIRNIPNEITDKAKEAIKAETDKAKKELEAEADKAKKELEAESEKAKQELEAAAQKRKEAREAESEKAKKELEEAAQKKAESLKKDAAKSLKKYF